MGKNGNPARGPDQFDGERRIRRVVLYEVARMGGQDAR